MGGSCFRKVVLPPESPKNASKLNRGIAQDTFSTMIFSWGSEKLSLAGGQYRLCWCSSAASTNISELGAHQSNRTVCATAGSFQVDGGRMTIIGVAPLRQDRTCLSGQMCIIDGIQGQHLSDRDLWLPMDTCGVPDQIISPAGRLVTTVSLSGSFVSWGNHALTLASGQYRLCWCSGDAHCSTSSQFSIDVGEFRMIGPSPLQSHTCVSGQTCVVMDVVGTGWEATDQFLVMETCGRSQAWETCEVKVPSNSKSKSSKPASVLDDSHRLPAGYPRTELDWASCCLERNLHDSDLEFSSCSRTGRQLSAVLVSGRDRIKQHQQLARLCCDGVCCRCRRAFCSWPYQEARVDLHLWSRMLSLWT